MLTAVGGSESVSGVVLKPAVYAAASADLSASLAATTESSRHAEPLTSLRTDLIVSVMCAGAPST